MNYEALTDLELMVLIEQGDTAKKEMVRRFNKHLDERRDALVRELADQDAAIGRVIFLQEQQKLPIVKKQMDRVLERMKERRSSLYSELDNISYGYQTAEHCGPARA